MIADTDTPDQSAADPLARFLCFSVYATGLAFNRLYKGLLDAHGLTYPQYLAMVVLGARDDQTVSELGEALFLESNTLTPLLKRLEAAGLVSRRRDSNDERVVRLSLTPAGRAVSDQLACVPSQVLEATGMSVEELGAIRDGLSRLGANLRESARR